MIPYKSLPLADIFTDCQNKFDNDKYAFLSLLDETISLDEIVPVSFISHFHAAIGRPRKHLLYPMLKALSHAAYRLISRYSYLLCLHALKSCFPHAPPENLAIPDFHPVEIMIVNLFRNYLSPQMCLNLVICLRLQKEYIIVWLAYTIHGRMHRHMPESFYLQ